MREKEGMCVESKNDIINHPMLGDNSNNFASMYHYMLKVIPSEDVVFLQSHNGQYLTTDGQSVFFSTPKYGKYTKYTKFDDFWIFR